MGNVNYEADLEELKAMFAEVGKVLDFRAPKDKDTARFKGHVFVDMRDSDALAAIEDLDEQEFAGRRLKINEARPRPARFNQMRGTKARR